MSMTQQPNVNKKHHGPSTIVNAIGDAISGVSKGVGDSIIAVSKGVGDVAKSVGHATTDTVGRAGAVAGRRGGKGESFQMMGAEDRTGRATVEAPRMRE